MAERSAQGIQRGKGEVPALSGGRVDPFPPPGKTRLEDFLELQKMPPPQNHVFRGLIRKNGQKLIKNMRGAKRTKRQWKKNSLGLRGPPPQDRPPQPWPGEELDPPSPWGLAPSPLYKTNVHLQPPLIMQSHRSHALGRDSKALCGD